MNLGFGQLLIILFLGFLLFGDFSKIVKILTAGISTLKKNIEEKDKKK